MAATTQRFAGKHPVGDQDLRRRPLATRDAAWAITAAGVLLRLRVPPKAISMASVMFACAAASLIALSPAQPPPCHALLLMGAAAAIQMRLLCNMLDGMVAIAGGRCSATGEGACAVLAVLTAYLRALGQALGCAPTFLGPMAKPQRMAAMTVGALIAALSCRWAHDALVFWVVLLVVALGAILTCLRRTRAIARRLRAP